MLVNQTRHLIINVCVWAFWNKYFSYLSVEWKKRRSYVRIIVLSVVYKLELIELATCKKKAQCLFMSIFFSWFDVSDYSDQLLYGEQMDDEFVVTWQHVLSYGEK